MRDKNKIKHFLERLERKLSKIPLAGKYLADVPVLISLVRDYINKEYAENPIGSIDDAAVIATAYKLVHDDVEEYKEWRMNKK